MLTMAANSYRVRQHRLEPPILSSRFILNVSGAVIGNVVIKIHLGGTWDMVTVLVS